MKKFQLQNFTKGWFIGNFEPTLFKTTDFEICVKNYQTGDKEGPHMHKIAQEFTVAVSGKYKMNGKELNAGEIILIEPGGYTDFECLESGSTTVVKIPCVKNDKYEATK